MAGFFGGASNFTIHGGNFTEVKGDLNQHTNYYSTVAFDSYNGYPDDAYFAPNDPPPRPPPVSPYNGYADGPYYSPNRPHPYYPYAQPHNIAPPPRRPRQRDYSQFGFTEYDTEESHYRGDRGYARYQTHYPGDRAYRGRTSPPGGAFIEAMRSPTTHVDIADAEYTHLARDDEPNAPDESQESDSSASESVPVSHDQGTSSLTSPSEEANGIVLEDTPSDAPRDSASVPLDPSLGARKPLTAVEKMRMSMADLEIIDPDEPPVAVPAAGATALPEEWSRSSRSKFGKYFQPRGGKKPYF